MNDRGKYAIILCTDDVSELWLSDVKDTWEEALGCVYNKLIEYIDMTKEYHLNNLMGHAEHFKDNSEMEKEFRKQYEKDRLEEGSISLPENMEGDGGVIITAKIYDSTESYIILWKSFDEKEEAQKL